MSYSRSLGLGALPAGQTLPIGTRLAAGYSVTGLTIPAGQAPAQLQEAMQAGFRGRTLRTGWGGGGDSAGVPAGHLFAEVEVAADGITTDTMNTIFGRVGQALAGRVGGTVRNTHAHVTRAVGGGASGGAQSKPGIVDKPGILDSLLPQIPETSTVPTSSGGGSSSGMVWALVIGGVAVVGIGVAAVTLRKPKTAVTANRRRR